ADGRDLLDATVGESAAGGATVVLGSHEFERATGLATRRLVVAGGRVVEGLLPDADAHATQDSGTGTAGTGDVAAAGVRTDDPRGRTNVVA
ncbi:MAG: hypothetical protein ACR2HV_01250, partial [Acidimicrobiales bacterium]